MKKLNSSIIVGKEVFQGVLIGVTGRSDNYFPIVITHIEKTEEGIFKFGDGYDCMIDYETLQKIINSSSGTLEFKRKILESMKYEIKNY